MSAGGRRHAILPRPIFSRFTRLSFPFPSASDACHADYLTAFCLYRQFPVAHNVCNDKHLMTGPGGNSEFCSLRLNARSQWRIKRVNRHV